MDTTTVPMRDHLHDIRRNPLDYLPEARYSVLVAYICGLDAASVPRPLAGFPEWAEQRVSGRTGSVNWWTVIAGMHAPAVLDGHQSVAMLTADQDREAAESLLQLLDEYLAV